MQNESWYSPLIAWSGCVAVAILLQFGPSSFSERLEDLVLDAAGGGLTVIHGAGESVRAAVNREPHTKAPQVADFEMLEAENRHLKLQIAELHTQLEQQAGLPTSPFVGTSAVRFVRPEFLSAQVLGRRTATDTSSTDYLISLGQQAGLTGEELVLSGPGLLVGAGQNAAVEPDRPVTAGKSLWGRTSRVGTLDLARPTTDRFGVSHRGPNHPPNSPRPGAGTTGNSLRYRFRLPTSECTGHRAGLRRRHHLYRITRLTRFAAHLLRTHRVCGTSKHRHALDNHCQRRHVARRCPGTSRHPPRGAQSATAFRAAPITSAATRENCSNMK